MNICKNYKCNFRYYNFSPTSKCFYYVLTIQVRNDPYHTLWCKIITGHWSDFAKFVSHPTVQGTNSSAYWITKNNYFSCHPLNKNLVNAVKLNPLVLYCYSFQPVYKYFYYLQTKLKYSPCANINNEQKDRLLI